MQSTMISPDTMTPIRQILEGLQKLPAPQVAEVRDFVLFLQARYGGPYDISDAWSDEDLRDLTAASLGSTR